MTVHNNDLFIKERIRVTFIIHHFYEEKSKCICLFILNRETFDLFYNMPSIKIGYPTGTERGLWMKKEGTLWKYISPVTYPLFSCYPQYQTSV